MFDVNNNVVPTNIQELFLPLSRVHSYNTWDRLNLKTFT